MLELLDDHIKQRLEIVLHEGNPVKVFDYLPERELDEAEYPCYAFQQHELEIQAGDARPNCELFIPSQTTEEIEVQDYLGGGNLEGPDGYTWKPYPTPVSVIYEVQARATTRLHAKKLQEGILQAFPPGYQPEINGQPILFVYGRPIYMDSLDKPEYCIAFILTLHDVWIDRAEFAAFKPIKTINFDMESE